MAGESRRYVVTGAPGTGKTSLLGALGAHGVVIAEPARELIAEHRRATGERSLDGRPGLFVERLIARSLEKFDEGGDHDVSFYDRALPDCVAYAVAFDIDPEPALSAAASRRYDEPVFVLPPWETIYRTDELRRMTFEMTGPFHDVLLDAYRRLEYRMVEVPTGPVAWRAAFVLRELAGGDTETAGSGDRPGA